MTGNGSYVNLSMLPWYCLQQFDKFWIWIKCNDQKRKWCEIFLSQEKIVKSHQVNTFLADFRHLRPKWVALPRVPRQDHNCNERRNPFSRDKWFLSLFKEVDILFNLEVLVKKRKLIQWAFLCMQQCHLNTAMNHNQNPGYFFWRVSLKSTLNNRLLSYFENRYQYYGLRQR